MIFLTLSFIIWLSYIIYINIKYKPNCISQSYYYLKNNIFPIWIFLVSILIFPAWVEISPENFQFLPFLSVVALTIVGIYPKYLSCDRIPHLGAAITTGILSVIWNIVTDTLIVPKLLLLLVCYILVSRVRKLFWIECLAFMNIYISILIKILN